MSHDEALIGTIAIVLAGTAFAIGIGPWSEPYRLRTFSNITQRFGKPVARGVWIAIAVASLTAGLSIISGLRPSYAVPAQNVDLNQR